MEGFVSSRFVVLRGDQAAVHVQGQRDHHRHGQGRADRPEDRGHAFVDRHAGPFSAPGRGVSRRLGPRPPGRRRRDAHAKRRNGRGRAAPAVAARVRRAAGGDHGGPHEHRGPGGQRGDRTRRSGGSLLARPRAQHQHDGDAGRGRRARPGAQQDAEFPGRRLRPVSSGRGAGPQAEPGGRHHASARRVPLRERVAFGARSDRHMHEAGPAQRGDHADRQGGPADRPVYRQRSGAAVRTARRDRRSIGRCAP